MKKSILTVLVINIFVLVNFCAVNVRAFGAEAVQQEPAEPVVIGTEGAGAPEKPADVEKTAERIHFIAINSAGGSSDAILVESNGQYGLIDASHPSGTSVPNIYTEYTGKGAGAQTVIEYLCGLAGVDHLSFVISTHAHSDHSGGIPEIAAAGLVNQNTIYIYKEYQCNEENDWHSDYYAKRALQAMKAKGARLVELRDLSQSELSVLGGIFVKDPRDKVGDHVVFPFGDFLISLYNMHTMSYSNDNLNSIVTVLQTVEASAVLMADMEIADEMEDRIASAIVRNEGIADIDVYKVGHHGYPGSNGVAAIAALNPRYSIVTTNLKSKDPFPSVYYNYILEKTGGEIYRTSEAEAGVVTDLTTEVKVFKMTYSGELGAATPWVTTYQTN